MNVLLQTSPFMMSKELVFNLLNCISEVQKDHIKRIKSLLKK